MQLEFWTSIQKKKKATRSKAKHKSKSIWPYGQAYIIVSHDHNTARTSVPCHTMQILVIYFKKNIYRHLSIWSNLNIL